MKIEVVDCHGCPLAFDQNDKLCCDIGGETLFVEDVPRKKVHKECPLRRGPLQFQLHGHQLRPEDVVKTKRCRDCGGTFDITHGELRFLEDRFGPSFGEPTRCKACRRARKAATA